MDYKKAGEQVLNILINASFEAYFVGGMVRDDLLGIKYNDIDITTNALPKDIMKLFPNTYDKGLKYNSVTVIYLNYEFEITTYRVDVEYLDHRHPLVGEADNLELDLKRRDFTINAMAMDLNGNVIDLNNGKKDLDEKLIKTVGDPKNRFTEDALRMIRACYFASKLNFTIETNTYSEMKNNAVLIKNISSERIIAELDKITSLPDNSKAFFYLYDSKLAYYIKGLDKAVKYCLDNKITKLDTMLLLMLVGYFSSELDDYYKISNKKRTIIERSVMLASVSDNSDFPKVMLYSYGLEVALYANSLNVLLNKDIDKSSIIKNNYEALPIKKTCDLKFKGEDIIKLNSKTPGYWLNDQVDDLKLLVINGDLENDYEVLKEYYIKNIL